MPRQRHSTAPGSQRTSSTRGRGCMTTASFFSSFMVSGVMMYLPLAFS